MSTPDREHLHQLDRTIVWHPFTQMQVYQPILLERGAGCTLFDDQGRGYLDGISSMWCNVHGHNHPRLNAALREQLDRVAHVTALGYSNSTTIRLAERLVAVTPPGLDHVFFSDDGATSVEVAIKMALQYWQQRAEPRPRKTRYVALGEAYHGDTLAGISVGGVDHFTRLFAPLCFEPLRLAMPDLYRLPPDVTRETACAYYLAEAERLLAEQHDTIAALIVEPLVQGAAGMVMQPPGYLAGLRELTRRYDVLLIADEVAVGFGRTGTMFACEQEQVVPDILCLAKGLTGGYLPLAATLATSEIYQAFLGPYESLRQFCHGHTYGGNPLGAAVALATLDVFAEEQTLAQLPAKIAQLRSLLAPLAELSHVGDIRQCGLIAGVELVQDRATQTPFPIAERRGYRVCQVALERGVLLRPLGNVIVIMPPLSISATELEQIVSAVAAGIRAAT